VQRQKTEKVATFHHTVRLQLLIGPAEIVGEDIIETSNVDHDDLFSVRRRRGCHPSPPPATFKEEPTVGEQHQFDARPDAYLREEVC
jgi:hypothetical protein